MADRTWILGVLVGVLGGGSVHGALATEAGATPPETAADGENLTEIVVTAEKRAERLQDVPLAVEVVGGAQLENQRIYTIADLARTAPGLEMIQAFGGPGGGGQIRGIGTNSFTRSAEGAVGIVIDGVPQGNVPNTNVFDVAQVEVLEGPQGTLFGLTSSAGVINMTTVAPDPSAFHAMAHVDYAAKGTAGSEYGDSVFRAAVNLPLTANSAVRISGNGNFLTGVEENAYTGTDNRAHDSGVRMRYLWTGDEIKVSLIGDYDHRTQNYGDPEFVYVDVPASSPIVGELKACGITASYANQRYCSNVPGYSGVINYGLSAEVDWTVGAGSITSITALRENTQSPSTAGIIADAAEFTQINTVNAIAAGKQVSQELRFASPSGQAFEYIVGAFGSSFTATTGYAAGGAFNVGTYDLAPVYVPFVKDGTSTETGIRSQALFGQTTYHFDGQWSGIFGLRYTHESLDDYQSTNPYASTSVANYGAATQSNVSGKLGLLYKVSTELTGYATITRGFKGPQVVPAAEGTPGSIVAAEIPTAYELGLKGSAFEERIGFTTSLFYSSVKDYQGQRCTINGSGVLVCVGTSIPSVTTKGLELNAFGRPLAGLTVNAGFMYDDATFPSGYTGFNPNDLRNPVAGTLIGETDMSGLQLVGVPKTKFTLSSEYSHAVGSLEAFVAGDAVHKSDLRLGYSADPEFVYPAHWNVGARLGLRAPGGAWSAEIFGRNLTNDHEPVTLFGGPSFLPPGAVPFLPNGQVNGVSGWMSPASLKLVGISVEARW